jgi:hypothetical protein
MKAKVYTKFVAKVCDSIPIPLEGITNIRVARQKVRLWLDKNRHAYASLTGYMGDTAVMISGVRSSTYKHMPVATATRG